MSLMRLRGCCCHLMGRDQEYRASCNLRDSITWQGIPCPKCQKPQLSYLAINGWITTEYPFNEYLLYMKYFQKALRLRHKSLLFLFNYQHHVLNTLGRMHFLKNIKQKSFKPCLSTINTSWKLIHSIVFLSINRAEVFSHVFMKYPTNGK